MKKLEFIREASGEHQSRCGKYRIDKDRGQWDVTYKGVLIARLSDYLDAEMAAQSHQPDPVAEIHAFIKEVQGIKEPQEGMIDALDALRYAANQAMRRVNDSIIAALPFKEGDMVVHKTSPATAKLSFIKTIETNPHHVSSIRMITAPATAKKEASKVNLREHELGKEISFLRHLRDDDAPVWDSKKGVWTLPW